MGWAVSDYFRYFTTLSNLTTALAAGFILPFAVNGIRRKRIVYPRWLFLMHYAGTICTTLTLLFALVFILPWDPAFAVGGGQKFLHIICPIAILTAFLLVEGGYLLTRRNTCFCLIPFLVYSLVYVVMVVLLGKERGGWEDLYMLNTYVPFYLSLPALWLLSYGLASVIRIASNRLAVMRKERLLSLWTEDMEPVEVNIEIYGLGRYNGLHDEKSEMSIPYDILESLAERYAMDPTALMKVYTKGLQDAVKEKQIIRHTASQEHPKTNTANTGKDTGQDHFRFIIQFQAGCHRRDMHSQVHSHQHESPVRHGKMHPSRERYRSHPIQERNRMTAHGHTAEGGKRKTEKKQDIQDGRDAAVWIVFSFKQYSVPLPVQDLMNDDKQRHTHANPFMHHFPGDLISHEEQQKDGHDRIHGPFDHIIRFCLGHGCVLSMNFLPQFFVPGLQNCLRHVSAFL